MNKQPEALRLADAIDPPTLFTSTSLRHHAAEELRRLHAANVELLEALRRVIDDEAPSYHDCTDNGEPECCWCIARAAIAKHGGTS